MGRLTPRRSARHKLSISQSQSELMARSLSCPTQSNPRLCQKAPPQTFGHFARTCRNTQCAEDALQLFHPAWDLSVVCTGSKISSCAIGRATEPLPLKHSDRSSTGMHTCQIAPWMTQQPICQSCSDASRGPTARFSSDLPRLTPDNTFEKMIGLAMKIFRVNESHNLAVDFGDTHSVPTRTSMPTGSPSCCRNERTKLASCMMSH